MSSDAESMCELDPKVKVILGKIDHELKLCREKSKYGLPTCDNLSRIQFLKNVLVMVEGKQYRGAL